MENTSSVNAVVVVEKYAALSSKILSYTHKLWGKSILEWVTMSLGKIDHTVIEIEAWGELLESIRQAADDSDITVALFSDTPLITNKTVIDAINVVANEGIPAIKMTKGYVFKTEYLMRLLTLDEIPTYYFDEEDFICACGYKQLSLISDILRNRILDYHMAHGVYIIDAGSTYIDSNVKIGSGATVYPNNYLFGSTVIESDVVLKQNCNLKNAIIKSGATVWQSSIEDSVVGNKTTVGPYAYIRNNTEIGEDCRIGDYVEIKNAKIGNKTKVAHLTYIGDAEIGEKCNFGCGVVFANYDGKNKAKTIVGNRAFIGCNCNLVAPLKIDDGAYIAAGTTVTKNVGEDKFVIGRVRQEEKDYKNNYKPE